MILETIPQIKELSVEEKLILAAEIRNEAEIQNSQDSANPKIVEMIKDLYDDYLLNRDNVTSWEEIKERRLGSDG